jgi:DNA repair exonuclease SbcCD ATPase subunit
MDALLRSSQNTASGHEEENSRTTEVENTLKEVEQKLRDAQDEISRLKTLQEERSHQEHPQVAEVAISGIEQVTEELHQTKEALDLANKQLHQLEHEMESKAIALEQVCGCHHYLTILYF